MIPIAPLPRRELQRFAAALRGGGVLVEEGGLADDRAPRTRVGLREEPAPDTLSGEDDSDDAASS